MGNIMNDEVDLHLGRRLRFRRRLLGLSQKDLGDACGVQFRQIQKYECAANRMSAVMIWRLSCALGVEVGYFFDGLPSARALAEDRSPVHRQWDMETSAS